MRMPDSYFVQNGCHNCASVFRKSDYDEGFYYYCGFNEPERPPCCSVAMGEYDFERSDLEFVAEYEDRWKVQTQVARMIVRSRGWIASQYDAWDNWSDGRGVEPWGKCLSWTLL